MLEVHHQVAVAEYTMSYPIDVNRCLQFFDSSFFSQLFLAVMFQLS
jgi:hypothetical protein